MLWAHKHLSIKQTLDFSQWTCSRVNPFTCLWWKSTSLWGVWEHIVLDCLRKKNNIAFSWESWMTCARNVNNNKEQIKALMVNRLSKGDERDWTKQNAWWPITSYTQENSNDVVRNGLSQITLFQPLTNSSNMHALHGPRHNCGGKTEWSSRA